MWFLLRKLCLLCFFIEILSIRSQGATISTRRPESATGVGQPVSKYGEISHLTSTWIDKIRSKYRICAEWMNRSTTVTDVERNEVNELLKNNKFDDYKNAVVALAKRETEQPNTENMTRQCFNKMMLFDNNVQMLFKTKYKKLMAPSLEMPRKRIVTFYSNLERALPRWKSRTLQSFLRRTGNSDDVVRMLRNELRGIPLSAQNNYIERFFARAERPGLRRTATIARRKKRSVQPRIRPMKILNFEGDEREDVLLAIPGDMLSEEGKNATRERVGNLNMWKWLNLDQVYELNMLYKTTGDIALVLERAYEQLLKTDGGLREMAVRSFRATCKELSRVILGDRNYEVIADMYDFGRTAAEINRKLNEFYMQMSERNKKYADMVAPACKVVYDIHTAPATRTSRKISEDNLFVKHIYWFTREQQIEIEKMLAENARTEQLLAKISDYYESMDSPSQQKVSGELKQLCQDRVKQLLGNESFEILKSLYEESASAELLITKFAQLVGNLKSEEERSTAEQLGIFCQKVYNVERFDPGELTLWLTSDQKLELGGLIQDPDVSDDAVYGRIFEFYEKADDKKKADARKIIESGCKRFVDRMFGDEIATKLEEHRSDGNHTAQMLSAELAMYAAEIKDEKNRIKAEKSIPICNRIYLGYKDDCFCNGHSSICGPFTHQCLNCADNTFGVQCEKCLDGFEGSALLGEMGCIPVEKGIEFTECTCNGHSSQCDYNGECLDCLHNTTGSQCEMCAEGFYGDATQGTTEDCTQCPCPDGGDCFINGDALVECRTCPNGTFGTMCELSLLQPETTTKIIEVII